jgi:phage shock protein PspC (stress-responsive transcriptional regulator)
MKKTISVNLGGRVFAIDEDAYSLLTEYLHDVKKYLKDDVSTEEVLNDIEQRMGELFTEWMQGNRQVVTKADVTRVTEILGKPESYDNQSETSSETNDNQSSNNSESSKTSDVNTGRRKLFRDPENAFIGGVCTGLGKYFDINPLLFRLIFFLLFWLGASGILLYILCWIIVPEAKTSSQRLEMEGEDVTIDNIEKKVREEYQKAKTKVDDYVKDEKMQHQSRSFGYRFGHFLAVLAKAFLGLVIGIVGISGFIILMTLLFVLIVVATGSVGFLGDWTYHWLPAQYLFMHPSSGSLMTIGLLLVIGLPFIAVFKLLFGRSRKTAPSAKWVTWLGIILWLIGLGIIIFSSMWFVNHVGWCW